MRGPRPDGHPCGYQLVAASFATVHHIAIQTAKAFVCATIYKGREAARFLRAEWRESSVGAGPSFEASDMHVEATL